MVTRRKSPTVMRKTRPRWTMIERTTVRWTRTK